MRRLKSLGLIAALCVMASTLVNVPASAAWPFSEKETVLLENGPMIDRDAVRAYKKGTISRETALSLIDGRLNELKEHGHIIGWSYDAEACEYLVIMNSGTLFSYIF